MRVNSVKLRQKIKAFVIFDVICNFNANRARYLHFYYGQKRPATHLFEQKNGVGNGIRTRDLCLGKATLYQLSYSHIRKFLIT